MKTVKIVIRYKREVVGTEDGLCKIEVNETNCKKLNDLLLSYNIKDRLVLVKSSNNKYVYNNESYDLVRAKYEIIDVKSGLYVVLSSSIKGLIEILKEHLDLYLKVLDGEQYKNIIEKTSKLPILTQEEYVKRWYNLSK